MYNKYGPWLLEGPFTQESSYLPFALARSPRAPHFTSARRPPSNISPARTDDSVSSVMTSFAVPAQATQYVNTHRPLWECAIAEAIGVAVSSQSSDPLRIIGQKLIAAADAASAGTPAPPAGDGLARAVAEARATVPASQQASDPHQAWKMAPWLDSLGTSGLIEAALMAPVREGSGADDPALVLPFVRALGKYGSRETVAALIREAGPTLLESLATTVWGGIEALGAAGSATGKELHDKFVQEGGAFTMSYGGLDTFFGGLEGLIGAPNPKLRESMKRDHCDSIDSQAEFHAGNYGTTTTSEIEYYFVVDPKGHPHEFPADSLLHADESRRHLCREAKVLADFAEPLQRTNAKLATLDCAPLCDEEFWGARLYTGPMFIKYNAILRGLGGKVPFFVSNLEKLCMGNQYTTTLHIINSACVKLSKVMTAQKVYRGVSGGTLPAEFWKKNEWNVAGGVEFAFMSTTLDKSVALHYAAAGGAGLCFEIQMGMVDRGADLSWLSQYPHESEILFAPMTGLEVLGTRVEGGVIVVETRLSVNLSALTIEQVVSRRRKLCMDMNASMALELMHEVNTPRWHELKALMEVPAAVAFDLPGYAKGVLRDMLDETTSFPPEHYNDETKLLKCMADAVRAKTALSSWPAGWERVLAAAIQGRKNCRAAFLSQGKPQAKAREAQKNAEDAPYGEGPELTAANIVEAKALYAKSDRNRELKAGGAGALSVLVRCMPKLERLRVYREELKPEGAVYLGHAIAANKTVTELDLSGNLLCGMDDCDEVSKYSPKNFVVFCTLLRSNTTLTSLNLSANYIRDVGGRALCEALELNPNLTSLNVADSSLMLGGWQALSRLVERSTALTTLDANCNLDKMRPTDVVAAAKTFAEAVGKNRSLTSLDLSSQEWKTAAGRQLECLLDNPNLATLNLSCSEVGAGLGPGLARRMRGHPSLAKLEIDYCALGAGAKPLCEAVGEVPRLTELNLSDNKLDEACCDALGSSLSKTATLAKLDISCNALRTGGIALGAGLRANASLTVLSMMDCRLGAEGGIGIFEALEKNTTLTDLDASDCKLSGAPLVAALGKALAANTALTKLNLSENKLGPLAEAALGGKGAAENGGGLSRNVALTDLDLSNCGLGAACAAFEEVFATNTALKKLQLDENRPGDATVAAMASGLHKSKALEDLSLRECDVGTDGGVALGAALEENTALRELDLSGNTKLAGGAVPIAKALEGNATLTKLNINDTAATDKVADALLATIKKNRALIALSVQDSEFKKPTATKLKDAWQTRAFELRKALDAKGDTAEVTWKIQLNESDTFNFYGKEKAAAAAPLSRPGASGASGGAASSVTADLLASLTGGATMTKEQILAEQAALKQMVAAGPPAGTDKATWMLEVQRRMTVLKAAALQHQMAGAAAAGGPSAAAAAAAAPAAPAAPAATAAAAAGRRSSTSRRSAASSVGNDDDDGGGDDDDSLSWSDSSDDDNK